MRIYISYCMTSLLKLKITIFFLAFQGQSVFPKLDIAELRELHILAFSETWLKTTRSNDDLFLQQYHPPERKDMVGDNHGGIMIYVRGNLHYTRRRDLEPQDVECLWTEIALKYKHILFGVF